MALVSHSGFFFPATVARVTLHSSQPPWVRSQKEFQSSYPVWLTWLTRCSEEAGEPCQTTGRHDDCPSKASRASFQESAKASVLGGWGASCFLETGLAILGSVKFLVLSSRKGSFLLSSLLLPWAADIIVSYLGQEGGVETAQSYGTH